MTIATWNAIKQSARCFIICCLGTIITPCLTIEDDMFVCNNCRETTFFFFFFLMSLWLFDWKESLSSFVLCEAAVREPLCDDSPWGFQVARLRRLWRKRHSAQREMIVAPGGPLIGCICRKQLTGNSLKTRWKSLPDAKLVWHVASRRRMWEFQDESPPLWPGLQRPSLIPSLSHPVSVGPRWDNQGIKSGRDRKELCEPDANKYYETWQSGKYTKRVIREWQDGAEFQ